MNAALLDGRELAQKLREKYRQDVQVLGRPVTLLTIRIGDAEDAKLYENAIGRLMEKVGVDHKKVHFSAAAGYTEVRDAIRASAVDPAITGVLILSPTPAHLPHAELVAALPHEKDAEGTRFEATQVRTFPPTALACFELVCAAGLPIAGRHAVVVGRSERVGRPAFTLLDKADATVTLCHSKTINLDTHIKAADIVIAAAGRAGLIKGEWIKPGAVIVDAGENVVDGVPVGDVEFESASQRAGYITPVPGGVGPVTSLMLVRNLLTLARASGGPRVS